MQAESYEGGRIVVGLDVGTTKICVAAANVSADGDFQIIGFGKAPSEGLNRGVVTNIRSAVKSIRKAVEECELTSGIKVEDVFTGIAGHHILGLNKDGVVAVTGNTIIKSDIQRVVEAARATNSPDKEIIHTLIQEYIVDGQDGVVDPIGMQGKRLEAKVHLILGSVTSAANLVQCCNDAGLNVLNIVLEPFASAMSVLDEQERELGVVLLDIGGGTSDMVIYKNGSIVHTSVLPLGGNQITNDIAIGLRTTKLEALRIKHEHGAALLSKVKDGEIINLKGIAGRDDRIIEKRLLAEVIEARFREIFHLIKNEIVRSGHGPNCAAGIVVTGGSSLMANITELAEEECQMPVRVGAPTNIQGLGEMVESPLYSTVVGLIMYGAEPEMEEASILTNSNSENLLANVSLSFKRLVKNFFNLF
ncbi:MAG: cell division protein FtsA [Deltaproteobacteria bacterium]|jgi:cell division protein FtsA|nr:cell division protein FtsA [Deltaproteobacteria bacterium]MBT4087375.1 cell division protein FtsA [Deltaproteobacteria bacterium]MBT4267264.1 cell division protein FtsA [Deltaproteobacteria bacterium]MBT4639356.1 cell division protein FtsA [Deltaproteobacteria bacterium]MBT6504640.1 cell division protein FtsA [Deltaproteobacteria bacterium]